MSNKTLIIIGAAVAIWLFAPPIVDFEKKGSRFNRWMNRNKKHEKDNIPKSKTPIPVTQKLS